MTTPLVPRILTILSRDDIHVLRHMRRSLAQSWLKTRYPDLDPADMADAVALAPEEGPPKRAFIAAIQPDPLRNLFISAAWLAGASYMQLSRVHGLTRQRIMEIIHRALPGEPPQRQAMRLTHLSHSDETVDAWRSAFYKFAKDTTVGQIARMEPMEVALILPYLPGAEEEAEDAAE